MPRAAIKPCPFCGGKGKLENDMDQHAYGYAWHWVACTRVRCSATGPSAECDRAKAVDLWNRRAS